MTDSPFDMLSFPPSSPQLPQTAPTVQRLVVGVRFSKVGKIYHFDYTSYPDLKLNDFVIVETLRGRQMGQVMGFTLPDPGREHKPIMRPATPRDLVLKQYWEDQQAEALVICREKAKDLGGFQDAKFIAAQYNYDGSNLTFMFSAEQKINTQRLQNELRKHFSQDHDIQIEMRQIGPRDVAKLLGGYGACGELRCCSTFLTDFSPISIKMAKVQGISLNPTEITGMCGRLRCCLVYEYEQYVEARKHLPKRNKRIGTPQGVGKVVEVYPLQDQVSVYIEEQGVLTFKREDLIPLDELEALQKKAKEPCSKHGPDEACDCGQKPGERNQDKAQTAQAQSVKQPVVPPAEPTQPIVGDETDADDVATAQAAPNAPKPNKKPKSKRNKNRNKKNAANKASRDLGSSESSADSAATSSKDNGDA